MAQINIPMGGRSVPIDVPDFAMESTQEQLLATMQQLVGGQSAATAKAASSIRTEQQTKQEIQKLGSKLQKDNRERMQGHARAMKDGVNSLGRQAIKVAQGGNEGFTGLLRSAGLGMIATQFGLVAGYAEELGNALSYGGRVGLTFGTNVLDTSKRLAGIGLSLTDFASTVGGSLTAMREFGNSVESGSQRFITAVRAFREASKEFGNFGMSSVEMAQYMADEIELRRRIMTADEMRLMTEEDLVASMKENLVQQERMAQVTGQDVQQRIQAQMAARSSQGGQIFLSGASDEQKRAFNSSAANLSMMGPMGKQMQQAMNNLLLGQDGLAAQALGPELMSAMPGLMDALKEQAAMIKAGASNEEIDQMFMTRLMAMRDQALGSGGLDTALERLATTIGGPFSELLEVFRKMAEVDAEGLKQMKKDAADRQSQTGDQRGLTAAQEEAFMQGRNLVNTFITGMMGGASNDVVDAYRGFIDAMNAGFSNPNTTQAIEAFGEAFGKIGIQPWAAVIAGDANWSEKMSVIGDMAAAIGANATIVASLKFQQGMSAVTGFLNDIKEMPAIRDSNIDMTQPIDWGSLKDGARDAIRMLIVNWDDMPLNPTNPQNPIPPTTTTPDQNPNE